MAQCRQSSVRKWRCTGRPSEHIRRKLQLPFVDLLLTPTASQLGRQRDYRINRVKKRIDLFADWMPWRRREVDARKSSTFTAADSLTNGYNERNIHSTLHSFPQYCVVFIAKRCNRIATFVCHYPNVTKLRSGICLRKSVCRLSYKTFVHRTQPVEIFRNVSMPFCILAIRWPLCKVLRRSSQLNPAVGG